MCGVYGIIGRTSKDFKADTLEKLALFTRVRGTDATGIAYIDPETGKLQIIKSAESAEVFIKKDEVQAALDNLPDIVIGHNRKKTVGDPSDNANNHPLFTKETGLALIHNGAASNHHKWRNTMDDGTHPFMYKPFDAQVDSEAILRLIETFLYIPRNEDLSVDPTVVFKTPKDQWFRGMVPTEFAIQDAVNNLSGGEACALLDEENPDTVYLWVTTNPMTIYYLKELDIIVFGSTEDIVDHSLENEEYEYNGYHKFFYEKVIKATHTPDCISYKVPDNTLIKIVHTVNADGTNSFNIEKFKLTPDKAATKPFDFKSVEEEEGEIKPFVATSDGIITTPDPQVN